MAGIGLPLDEQLHGVAGRRHDPFDVLLGVEPDVRRHDRQVEMAARGQRLDADAAALQVADAADRLAREQLVAADVQATDRGDRQARIEMVDDGSAEAGGEIHVALRHHLRRAEPPGGSHISDVREAFGAQELLGDIQWGEADPRREASLIVVVSGGPSSASDRPAPPRPPAAPAAANPARKSRRFCMMCIGSLPCSVLRAPLAGPTSSARA